MKHISRYTLLSALLLLALFVWANFGVNTDILKQGERGNFDGTLRLNEEIWTLDTEGKSWKLITAPQDFFSDQLELKPGMTVEIDGYGYEDQILVIALTSGALTVRMHTPEGFPRWGVQSRPVFGVDAARCIGCRLCERFCPEGAIFMVNGKAVIDQDKCIRCGICATGNKQRFRGCPTSAVTSEPVE